jgi:hypothetical protein
VRAVGAFLGAFEVRMIASLHLPLAFGVDCRKRASVLLRPELHAQATDAARRRGWSFVQLSEQAFDWFLNVTFLDHENREFLHDLVRELGAPWDWPAVLNRVVSEYREQVRSGKLRPSFWLGQVRSLTKV